MPEEGQTETSSAKAYIVQQSWKTQLPTGWCVHNKGSCQIHGTFHVISIFLWKYVNLKLLITKGSRQKGKSYSRILQLLSKSKKLLGFILCSPQKGCFAQTNPRSITFFSYTYLRITPALRQKKKEVNLGVEKLKHIIILKFCMQLNWRENRNNDDSVDIELTA